MDKIKNIIDYIAISIVPIAGFILTFLTYLISKKQQDIEKEATKQNKQQNINGDNYIYEDNRKIQITNLSVQKQHLSDRQQNIDDMKIFLSKYSGIYLLIIYGINVWQLMVPLPNFPVVSLNLEADTLLKHTVNSLYRAILPTTVNLLLLIALMCLALALKKALASVGIKRFIFAIYYIIVAIIYFYCKNIVSTIDLQKINFSNFTNSTTTLQGFINFIFPFAVVFILIFVWFFASMLMNILFETKYSQPNFKLFRVVVPRTFFNVFLLLFPFLIDQVVQLI